MDDFYSDCTFDKKIMQGSFILKRKEMKHFQGQRIYLIFQELLCSTFSKQILLVRKAKYYYGNYNCSSIVVKFEMR